MRSGENNPFSETGIWNVAGEFSFDILMYHIYWIDRYEILAEYGASDFNQDINLSESDKSASKVKGLQWFYKHLSMLISNSKFAVKKEKDRTKLEEFQKELIEIKQYINGSFSEKINQKESTTSIKINDKLFSLVYSRIVKIREELYTILHKNNIIFKYVADMDPKTLKEKWKHKLENEG